MKTKGQNKPSSTEVIQPEKISQGISQNDNRSKDQILTKGSSFISTPFLKRPKSKTMYEFIFILEHKNFTILQ